MRRPLCFMQHLIHLHCNPGLLIMSSVAARCVAGQDLNTLDIKEVLSNVLCEFLEVAFHLILYIREIYPPVLFERRRKYNVPVHMCVHPELNQYLRDVLDGLRVLMSEGTMDGVWLSIHNKEHKVVEKFTFELRVVDQGVISSDTHLLQLERDLRAMLLKISVCDTLLPQLPPECTFSIQVQTTLRSAEAMEHQQAIKEFPWVTADSTLSTDLTSGSVVPLKAVSSSLLQMELCVMEAPLKSKDHNLLSPI